MDDRDCLAEINIYMENEADISISTSIYPETNDVIGEALDEIEKLIAFARGLNETKLSEKGKRVTWDRSIRKMHT